MKKFLKRLLVLVIAIALVFPITTVFAEPNVVELEEVNITGELVLEELEEGALPEYTVSTTTEHITIEAYGSNTNWAQLSNGEWIGFGGETPTAVADGTFYAMRLCVKTEDNYVLTNNTKIIYNGRDMYDTYSAITPMDWGGYVYVDFAEVRNDQYPDPVIEPTPEVVGDKIIKVALNVDLPRVGDEVTVTETTTLTQNPQADVHIMNEDPYQLDNADGQYMYYFDTETGTFFNGKFEAGKNYRMHIWLVAREGFEFDDSVIALVNGERATFLRDENGYIVEYEFIPEAPDVEYTISTEDGSVIATFNFPEGQQFSIEVVDILTLDPEVIAEEYDIPAEYIEQAIAIIKEKVKSYGDLISLYAIEIHGDNFTYSEGVVLRFKMTPAMEKYNSFKFLFLDENNEFKVDEEHTAKVVTIDGVKYVEVELDHLSAYALVGTNVEENNGNPTTGDNIIFYVSMLSLCTLGLVAAGIYAKKKYYFKTVKQD